jgi:UDP-glucose 4-epimerase
LTGSKNIMAMGTRIMNTSNSTTTLVSEVLWMVYRICSYEGKRPKRKGNYRNYFCEDKQLETKLQWHTARHLRLVSWLTTSNKGPVWIL